MRTLTSTFFTFFTLLMFFVVSQPRKPATFAPRSPPSGRGCLCVCSSPNPLSPHPLTQRPHHLGGACTPPSPSACIFTLDQESYRFLAACVQLTGPRAVSIGSTSGLRLASWQASLRC